MTIEFHRTAMGQQFFDRTMPQLVSEVGKLGGQLGILEQAISKLADATDQRRLRVLIVSCDVELLRELRFALGDRHELHLARMYSVAEEILALHEIDVLVTEPVCGWMPAGSALFDLARAAWVQTRCALLLKSGTLEERETLALRREADAAIDSSTSESAIRGVDQLIRFSNRRPPQAR